MTKQEAKRYAHKVAANALGGALSTIEDESSRFYDTHDGRLVITALRALVEQHMRFGPKTTDKAPQLSAPLDTPLFDVLDREPRQAAFPDGRP